jgi:hypothetical protein
MVEDKASNAARRHGETMRHFYDAITLEPKVLAALEWQPIESYDVRPMDAIRRGRPLPALLRQGDTWAFAVWNRGHGWMCNEGDRAGEILEGFEPTHWAAPSEDLAFRLAAG